jgi:hypothetical protein
MFAVPEHIDDIRMMQPCNRPRLAIKTGSARNEVRAKELVFRPRMDANTRE